MLADLGVLGSNKDRPEQSIPWLCLMGLMGNKSFSQLARLYWIGEGKPSNQVASAFLVSVMGTGPHLLSPASSWADRDAWPRNVDEPQLGCPGAWVPGRAWPSISLLEANAIRRCKSVWSLAWLPPLS